MSASHIHAKTITGLPLRLASSYMKIFTVVLLVVAVIVSGCGRDNKRDLEGVESLDPDSATVYNNVDDHPNLAWLCINGVAFVTTTRNYGDAVMRVPEWDQDCKIRAAAP